MQAAKRRHQAASSLYGRSEKTGLERWDLDANGVLVYLNTYDMIALQSVSKRWHDTLASPQTRHGWIAGKQLSSLLHDTFQPMLRETKRCATCGAWCRSSPIVYHPLVPEANRLFCCVDPLVAMDAMQPLPARPLTVPRFHPSSPALPFCRPWTWIAPG